MLSRSILTLMIPVPLIVFGLCAAFFIEYQKHQAGVAAFGGQKLTPTQYVKLRVDTYREQSEAKAAVAEIDIRYSLPAAPEGWTRGSYEVAHGEQITGVSFKPSAVSKDTEKSIQDSFRAVKSGQKDAVTASYTKGDQIIAVKIRAIPTIDTTTLEGKLAERVSQMAVDLEDETPVPDFTIADDIAFKQLPQISRDIISGETQPVGYRRFEGGIGEQLTIMIFSNANDAAILDIIHGIDYAALKEFAQISKAIAVRVDPELDGVAATPEQVREAAAKALSDALGTYSSEGDATVEKASATNAEQAELKAERIDEQIVAAALDEEEPAKKLSFRDRLRGLLGAGTFSDAADEATQKPVCTIVQGFKRCVFVDE